MTKISYKTKFLQHLENAKMPLINRLQMAFGAIISQNFPLPNKEQIVIDWMARVLQENYSCCDIILEMIQKTLACDWFVAFSDPIDGSNLIETFVQPNFNENGRYSRSIATCLMLLLQNPGFQRFCRFEIQPMCQATVVICDLMSSIRLGSKEVLMSDSEGDWVSTELGGLLDSIHNIYKVTQQRNELKLHFVKSMLPALLKLKYDFQNCTVFQHLFEELVIGEDFGLICEAFKPETKRKVSSHLKVLVNLMTDDEQKCDIMVLSSLLFDVYVQSCLRNSKFEPNHLPMFYILTSVSGFHLQLPYTTVVNPHVVGAKQLLVLKALLGVLEKHNIPVASESEEGVLSTSLIQIEKEILSEKWQVSVELLQTLQIMFSVYPESIRLIFSEFAHHIIFIEKSNSKIIKCYNNLLTTVVKTFSDLSQLDKFFALFLHKSVLACKEGRLSLRTIDMIVTKGCFTSLSDKIPSLTGNQLKNIIGRMEKTFSKDVVSQLENTHSEDVNLRSITEIIVKMVCHVLENAYMVLPTRWNILSEEVKTLASTIQRFGTAILDMNDVDLSSLLGFLQLVRVTVDIELSLNHYTVSLATEQIPPRVKSKDKSHNVHNLSKSHGFLSTSNWARISQLVEESHNTQLKHTWFDLLMQKFVRCGDQDVLTYLTLHTDGDWLWSSLPGLASNIPLDHLELYTCHLLAPDILSAGNFTDKLAALQNIDVFTNRPFRAAINLQLLKLVSKSLPSKSVLSRKMIKLIDVQSVVKYEAEMLQLENAPEISVMTEALAEIVNKCHWDNIPTAPLKEEKNYIVRLIDFITILSPHCLKTETKRILCLTLMTLAYDLRGEEDLLKNILEILIGCLDDGSSVVPEALSRRVVMYWLVTVVPANYPLRHDLLRLVVTKVFHDLNKCVDVARGDSDLLCAMLEILIQAHRNKSLKNKMEFENIMKQLIVMSSSLYGKKEKEKFLKLYTISLKAECVFFKNKIQAILSNLPGYLDILLNRLAENFVVEADAVELINLTLSLKPLIEGDIIDKVQTSVTKELCKVNLCPMLCYPTTVRVFFESLSSQEFESVINEICKRQKKALTSDMAGQSTLSNVCELWTIVVSTHINKEKAIMRQKLLTKTLGLCHFLLERNPSKIDPAVIKLLHTVVISKSIFLAPKLFDLIFVILDEVPTDTEPYLLPECLSVLDSLINVRADFLFDRIPVFLQRLRKFIKSLVLLAPTKNSDILTLSTISTASLNHVTRILKTITDQHSKHFARISPYLIADMLHFLVSYSIEPSIKSELQNCVCILLTICDHRGTQLLQSLLPLPATELFKVLSTTFNKIYKYTGKV